jgi:hypothetical protein
VLYVKWKHFSHRQVIDLVHALNEVAEPHYALTRISCCCSKSPGIYNATFWKKIVDSSTTIAGQASYLPPPGENNFPPDAGVGPGFKFSVGLKHSVDPTLYWKTRVSTDGASFLVKKSDASGMFSVKGAMNVDFSDPWRIKKLGVVCSFRL